MEPLIVKLVALGIDAAIQLIQANKLSAEELAVLYAKMDELKAARDAAVDEFNDLIGE